MAASQQQTVLPKSGQTEQHITTIEPSSLLEGSIDISITDPWEPQSIQNAWPPSAFDADPTVPKKQQQGNLPPNKQLCPCRTMQLPPHRTQETPTQQVPVIGTERKNPPSRNGRTPPPGTERRTPPSRNGRTPPPGTEEPPLQERKNPPLQERKNPPLQERKNPSLQERKDTPLKLTSKPPPPAPPPIHPEQARYARDKRGFPDPQPHLQSVKRVKRVAYTSHLIWPTEANVGSVDFGRRLQKMIGETMSILEQGLHRLTA